METKFQTSFIPKKPIATNEKKHSHVGSSVFMTIATLVFIASVAGAGFVIVWKNVLNKSQENYKLQLAESKKRFNTNLIEDLRKANTKIDLTKQILSNHLEVTSIFSIISKLTIQGVRFTSFDFSAPDKDGEGIKISMKGVASSFTSIAYQAEVFGKSEKFGSNKILKNPVISGLAVDEKGYVGFDFTTVINPDDILYEKILAAELESEGSLIPSGN